MSNSDALARLQASNAAKQAAAAEVQAAKESPAEEMYQEFRSARTAQRVIAPSGEQILFTGSRYFTKDPEIIEWLTAEIKKAPLMGITLGEQVPSSARDPNKAYRDQLKEELRKQIEAEMLEKLRTGQLRDFGNYAPAVSGSGATTTSTMIGADSAE